MYIVEAVRELKEMNQLLMQGQDQLKITAVRLVEAFKSVDRLHKKVDQLEEQYRIKDKEQDEKIDNVRMFTWKVSGVAASIPILISGMALIGKILGWY
jgi:SMC interacting uncharacterized protein involved in chromosome segregation